MAESQRFEPIERVRTPSPREMAALESELMELEASEQQELSERARELRDIGARVAAREQHDWEEQQIAALVRPSSPPSAHPAVGAGPTGKLCKSSGRSLAGPSGWSFRICHLTQFGQMANLRIFPQIL